MGSEMCIRDRNEFYHGLFREDALQYRRMEKVIPHFLPQSHWVGKAEEMGLGIHFYDFHNFDSEYERLLDDMALLRRPRLAHLMNNQRAPGKDWRKEMSAETIELLADFYSDDFALLERAGFAAG